MEAPANLWSPPFTIRSVQLNPKLKPIYSKLSVFYIHGCVYLFGMNARLHVHPDEASQETIPTLQVRNIYVHAHIFQPFDSTAFVNDVGACFIEAVQAFWQVGNQGDGLLDDFVARSKVAVESKDIQLVCFIFSIHLFFFRNSAKKIQSGPCADCSLGGFKEAPARGGGGGGCFIEAFPLAPTTQRGRSTLL